MRPHSLRLSVGALGALGLMLTGCQSQDEAEPSAVQEDSVPPPPQLVSAQLQDADSKAVGEATVAEGDGNLLLTLNVSGLEPGTHGVHIHSIGRCDAPDFKSAAGHWNPTASQHGLDNPEGSHSGDLPNLVVADDGSGSLEATIEGASISEGKMALLDADGAAFVVHVGEDDQVTDPSGDSGSRIACGVFLPQ